MGNNPILFIDPSGGSVLPSWAELIKLADQFAVTATTLASNTASAANLFARALLNGAGNILGANFLAGQTTQIYGGHIAFEGRNIPYYVQGVLPNQGYVSPNISYIEANTVPLDELGNRIIEPGSQGLEPFRFVESPVETVTSVSSNISNGNYLLAAVESVGFVPIIGKALKGPLRKFFRIGRNKSTPNYLYHYTSREAAESISENGLKVGRDGFSYLTNNGNLSPLQSQIELALPSNRALPNSLLRIDARGLRKVGITPAVGPRRVQGNLPGLGAGGGTEFLFNQPIPANLIKKIN